MALTIEKLDTEAGLNWLIKSDWRLFGAIAYEGFLLRGRGAILVDLSEVQLSGDRLSYFPTYVVKGGEWLSKYGDWPDVGLAGYVREYDPESEVVFVFVRLSGVIMWARVNRPDEMLPRRAYEIKKEGLPLDFRLKPNVNDRELLKLTIARQREIAQQWDQLEKQILRDTATAAGFLKSLEKSIQLLREKVRAWGADENSGLFVRKELAPRTKHEEMLMGMDLLTYQLLIAATGAAGAAYKSGVSVGKDIGSLVYDSAKASIETYRVKFPLVVGMLMTSDEIPEDARGYWTKVLSSIMRTRLKLGTDSRVDKSLESNGKWETSLLERIEGAVTLGWSSYEESEHEPESNSFSQLRTAVVKLLSDDEPLDDRDERLWRERVRKQNDRQDHSKSKRPSVDDLTNQPSSDQFEEFERQQEARAKLAEAIRKAGLSDFELKASLLQQDGYTAKDIASQLNKKEDQVKQALWRARSKFEKLRSLDDK